MPKKEINERLSSLITHHWGLLATLVVGLLAIWLTVADGLPYGHDSELHIYRLVVWDELVRQGTFFSRWVPFLGYGYGSPLFNYYPPLLYMVAEPFLLAGLKPLLALRVTLGLALIGGALGIYRWVCDLFGTGAGIIGATTFIFSPYVMYTLLNRASFSEVVALACMPWGLWAIYRYGTTNATTSGLAYAIGTALIVAATLLTHLFSAYVFIANLLLYVLALSLTTKAGLIGQSNGQSRLSSLLRLSWPLVLGLGLAAFVWLPALWEADYVQIERVLLIADPTTGQGLVPPWQVFTLTGARSTIDSVVQVPPRLSVLAAGLALWGVVSGVMALRSWALKGHLLIGVATIGMALFMHTPGSLWLWQTIPMLRFGIFPFRFLGVASLWLALLAGAGVGALLALVPLLERPEQPKKRRKRKGHADAGNWWPLFQGDATQWGTRAAIVAGASLLLLLYALNWSAIAYHPADLPTDVASAMQFERESEAIGLISAGEYQPTTVKERPPAIYSPEVARLSASSMPDEARLLAAHDDLLRYRATIDSPQPFQIIINTFYFPGWQATINGQPVPITPTSRYGLISLPVPAGQQQIEVYFGSTPVRNVASVLSLARVIAVLALLFRGLPT